MWANYRKPLCVKCHYLWCTSNLFWNSYRYTVKNHTHAQHKIQTFSSMYITKRTPNIKVTWLSSSPSNLTLPFRFDCKGIETYLTLYNTILFLFSWGLLAWVSVTELPIISKADYSVPLTYLTTNQMHTKMYNKFHYFIILEASLTSSLKVLVCFPLLKKKTIIYIAYTAYVPLYCLWNVNFLHSALPMFISHLDTQLCDFYTFYLILSFQKLR